MSRLFDLINYGLKESNEYPIDYDTPASTGDAADHNMVNNMGDNPMKDPSIEEDALMSPTKLSRFNVILNEKGVHDSDIAMMDVEINDDDIVEVLFELTGQEYAVEEAKGVFETLLGKLSERLLGDDKITEEEEEENEPHKRFSFFVDSLGTLTIYDALEGNEVTLTGQEATALADTLHDSSEEEIQEILASYEKIMEEGGLGSVGVGGYVGDIGTQPYGAYRTQAVATPDMDEMAQAIARITNELAERSESVKQNPSMDITTWYQQNAVTNGLDAAVEQLRYVLQSLEP